MEWSGVRTSLQRAGLLLHPSTQEDSSRCSTRLCYRGVSLAWLEGVAEALQEHAPTFTALDLIRSKFARQHRLWDSVPQHFTGPPSIRVVHAWNAPLASTLSTLVQQLHLRPDPLTDGPTVTSTHLWIDFVALDGAQLLTWAGRDEGGAEGQGDADGLIATARELSGGGVGSALLVANAAGVVMGSFRCLYDAWAALTYCGGDALAAGLALPADADPALTTRIMAAAHHLNLPRLAAAGEERGEGACAGLLAEIKRLSGAQRACGVLGGALGGGLRLALQEAAPHSLRAAALRVGLFVGEGSLRLALACAKQTVAQYDVTPSYGDVCALFAVHAGGEAGGQWLGEEEAAAALRDAGMEDGEAGEVLWGMQERDTGAVSQTKWCDWWKRAMVVGLTKYTGSWTTSLHGKPEHATHRQLAALLVKLCAALIAHKMGELEAYIRGTWTSVTQQQQHGSRAAPGTSSVSAAPPSYSPAPHSARSSAASQPPSVCLAPAPVSILKTSGAAGTGAPGRWPLLDSAQLDAPLPAVVGAGAWRAAGLAALHASKRSVEDMGEAARRLYDVLLNNTDLLPCHPLHLPRPPPLTPVPSFTTAGSGAAGTAAKKGPAGEEGSSSNPVRTMLCLAAYMEVYGGHMLPALLGGVSDECGTMAEAAADLRSRASPGAKSLLAATSTLTTTEGQLLLMDLIGLKYGEQLASRAMRVEAGLVMSTLTAAARRASVSLPAGAGGGGGGGGFTGSSSKGSGGGRLDALDTYLARGNSLDVMDRALPPCRTAPIPAAAVKAAMVRRCSTVTKNTHVHADVDFDAPPPATGPHAPPTAPQGTSKSRRSSLAMPAPTFDSVFTSPGEFARASCALATPRSQPASGLLSTQGSRLSALYSSRGGPEGSEGGSQGIAEESDGEWDDMLLTSTLMSDGVKSALCRLSGTTPVVPPLNLRLPAQLSSVGSPRRSVGGCIPESRATSRESSQCGPLQPTPRERSTSVAGATPRRSELGRGREAAVLAAARSAVAGSPFAPVSAQLSTLGAPHAYARIRSEPPSAGATPSASPRGSRNDSGSHGSVCAPLALALTAPPAGAKGSRAAPGHEGALRKREASWMVLMRGGGSSGGKDEAAAGEAGYDGTSSPRCCGSRGPLDVASLPNLTRTSSSGGGAGGAADEGPAAGMVSPRARAWRATATHPHSDPQCGNSGPLPHPHPRPLSRMGSSLAALMHSDPDALAAGAGASGAAAYAASSPQLGGLAGLVLPPLH